MTNTARVRPFVEAPPRTPAFHTGARRLRLEGRKGMNHVDSLTHLSLFSGYGGADLGLKLWGELAGVDVRTVAYVEIESYAQSILQSRISDGALDDAPIWDDVTTFDGKPWAGRVDLLSGGFPCQDISCAGKGAGLEGKRSGLFYEIVRLLGEVRPRFVLLENVSAIYVRGLDTVLGKLAEAGYDARWTAVRASDVGAPHRRERWFCLAHLPGSESRQQAEPEGREDTGRGSEEGRGRGARTAAATMWQRKRRRPRTGRGFGRRTRTEAAAAI